MRLIAALAVAVAAAAEAGAAGKGDAGANTADFLRLGTSARATAQGEAYAGRGGEIESLQYNPAGLGRMDSGAILLQHNNYLLDISSNYAAFALPFSRFTVGASFFQMDHGDFTRRTLSSPGGAGTFQAGALAAQVGVGVPVGRSVSVGLSIKGFDEEIDNVNRTGWAADAGVHYRPERYPEFEVGVAARNMGPQARFDFDKEDLPFEIAFGASTRLWSDRIRLSGELSHVRDQELAYKGGLELKVTRAILLRGGYDSRNDLGEGYSLGAGFRAGGLELNYSWLPFNDAGEAHRAGLIWNFESPTR